MRITTTTEIWQLPLTLGASPHPSRGACAMDAISWLVYGRLGDKPACVCPIIADYVRAMNDSLNDVDRQKLRCYLARLIDTVEPSTEHQRALFLFHHAIRVMLPVAIDNSYWLWHRGFQQQCLNFVYGESYIHRYSWYSIGKRFPRARVQLYAPNAVTTFASGLICDLSKSMKPNLVSVMFAGLDGVLAIGRRSSDFRVGKSRHRLDGNHIRHATERFQAEALCLSVT